MPTNVNINVTARRNTGESDQSYASNERDSSSQPYASSSNTSPLDPEDSAYRRKSLPVSRSAPKHHSRSRSRPQSRVDDYFEEEEEDFELPLGPSISIPGPAPEPPTARSQRASAPASREASEEREPLRERREKPKRHHHKKHHHHRRRARSPSETTTEEMADRGFVNEFGQWMAAPERSQYPPPHDYIAAQQYQQAQSTHPGALVPTNQYNPQSAMYHPQGYPPQTPFYPQQMSPNSGLGMMMPPFFPYNMMGGMQPPSPPPVESDELRRLKDEMAAQRAKEQRAYDDYVRAQQCKQDERIERDELEKIKKEVVQKALNDYRLAEADKAEQAKAIEKAIADAKKAADEAAAVKAKEKEDEHKKKLDEANTKMEEAKKAADAAKKELKEVKGPPDNDKKVGIEICAANMKSKKFNIPWPHSKSWKTLQPLLLDAYERSDDNVGPMLAARMEDGHFDVTDSTGGAIMVQYWDMMIKPDTNVKVTVRVPEAPAAKHHIVDVPGHKHKGEHGIHRSKSGKTKKRQSKVMFGELPSDMPGPAPPPPLATYGGPGGPMMAEDDDDIVEIVEGSSSGGPVMSKKKKKKQPGMMDILFRGGKTKK